MSFHLLSEIASRPRSGASTPFSAALPTSFAFASRIVSRAASSRSMQRSSQAFFSRVARRTRGEREGAHLLLKRRRSSRPRREARSAQAVAGRLARLLAGLAACLLADGVFRGGHLGILGSADPVWRSRFGELVSGFAVESGRSS
jgi:hypothetical protein